MEGKIRFLFNGLPVLCNDTTSRSVVPNTSWAMLVLGRVKIYRQKTLWGDRRDPLARKKLEESDGKVRKKKSAVILFQMQRNRLFRIYRGLLPSFFGMIRTDYV